MNRKIYIPLERPNQSLVVEETPTAAFRTLTMIGEYPLKLLEIDLTIFRPSGHGLLLRASHGDYSTFFKYDVDETTSSEVGTRIVDRHTYYKD